ncbi:MAG: polysaccharide deacetylase family protein, partial [Gemmatimonadota bacterium]
RHALPTLERHGIPATVFVTTGYVGGTREFWWDALEAVLLRPGRLPDKLRLQTDGFKLEADLGPNAEYSEPDFTVYRGWNWRSSTDPTQRHRLFRRLSAELRRLEDGHRTRVLDELAAWAGSTQRVRPDYRALTAEEVVQLARSGLVRIGAHSVTHPLLSCQAARRQWEEIHGSRMFLEDILQTPVTTFAYPYGMSGKAAAIVKRAGFALACTTRPGIVFSRRRPYHLPRLYVGDWDGDEFERRLRSLP